VSSGKFVRAVILPLRGKDCLSIKEESDWKRTGLWESSFQAPQRRRSLSLVGCELRETNPCVSLWFASLSWFLAYLICFYFDLLGCAICVLQGSLPYLWSSTKATHQVWFVPEVKRSLKLILQVLCGSLVWPMEDNGLIGATCWAAPVTGLTN
jgi:hypothetical protein